MPALSGVWLTVGFGFAAEFLVDQNQAVAVAAGENQPVVDVVGTGGVRDLLRNKLRQETVGEVIVVLVCLVDQVIHPLEQFVLLRPDQIEGLDWVVPLAGRGLDRGKLGLAVTVVEIVDKQVHVGQFASCLCPKPFCHAGQPADACPGGHRKIEKGGRGLDADLFVEGFGDFVVEGFAETHGKGSREARDICRDSRAGSGRRQARELVHSGTLRLWRSRMSCRNDRQAIASSAVIVFRRRML